MSQTPNTTPESEVAPARAEKPRSPITLIALLLVMATLAGALAIDKFVFEPACNKADEALTNAAIAHSEKSLKETNNQAFLTSDDVKEVIGFAPTKRVDKGHYLKEYYCWWGPLPLNRRYITVVYDDPQGKRYIAHQVENEVPGDIVPKSAEEIRKMLEEAAKAAGPSKGPLAPMSAGPPGGVRPGQSSEEPTDDAVKTDAPKDDESKADKPKSDEPKEDEPKAEDKKDEEKKESDEKDEKEPAKPAENP
jgi:hypothetical protein